MNFRVVGTHCARKNYTGKWQPFYYTSVAIPAAKLFFYATTSLCPLRFTSDLPVTDRLHMHMFAP